MSTLPNGVALTCPAPSIPDPWGDFSQSACAPFALKLVLNESWHQAAGRIHALGGNYRAVTQDLLHAVITHARPQARQVAYPASPKFQRWRRGRRGLWFVCAHLPGRLSAHAIVLRDGRAYDNGWASEWMHILRELRVLTAWKIHE